MVKKGEVKQERNSIDPDNEKIVAKKIITFWHIIDKLSSKSDFVARLYEKTVGREYRKEREKFNLSKSKRILHIGCGSYPITAMILSEIKGVKVVTIDFNKKLVGLAKKVLEEKNLNDRILADVGDGKKYPLKGFDTIVISGCSIPKMKVVEHILEEADKDSRIIIRELYYKDEILDIVNSKKDVKFVEEFYNKAFPTCRWESLLFSKK